MSSYVRQLSDIRFGGGDLKINLVNMDYGSFANFTSLGASDRETGGVLHIGEKRLHVVNREMDLGEPSIQWVEGQEVTFETTLVEADLANLALAMGEDPAQVGDNTGTSPKYKFLRAPSSALPRYFPMVYEVPKEEGGGLKTRLIMPVCELIGGTDLAMVDGRPRVLKLVLRLHKVPQNPPTEVLTNSDLEHVSSGSFTGWAHTETGGWMADIFNGSVDQAVDADGNRIEPVHGGLRSLRLASLGTAGTAYITQTATVEENKTYEFSVWHYSENPGATLKVTLGSTDYPVQTSLILGKWVRFLKQVVIPDNVSTLIVKLSVTALSTVGYFDDVSLQLVRASSESESLEGRKFEIREEYA
jgi:hypothetical protein